MSENFSAVVAIPDDGLAVDVVDPVVELAVVPVVEPVIVLVVAVVSLV